MKQKGNLLSIVIIVVALLVSCATTPPPPKPSCTYSTKSEKSTGLVNMDVDLRWRVLGYSGLAGVDGFNVKFTNLTDKVVKIVWEQSSFVHSGVSSQMFIDGQKYAEASRPMSPTIIPPRSAIVKSIFPAEQVHYYQGGWDIVPLPNTGSFSLIFCIQAEGVEDFYTTKIVLGQ